MPTITEVMQADLAAAINELPVTIRYLGQEIPASFNGGRLTLEAADGGILDDQNATILVLASLLPDPKPETDSQVEVLMPGPVWKLYKVLAATERNDPLGVGIALVVGPPNR